MPLGCARAAMMGAAGLSVGPPRFYLYNQGVEVVAWVEGYSEGSGSRSKESDHLFMEAIAAGDPARRAYETANAIDLTGWVNVCVDWECTRMDDLSGWSFVGLSVVYAANHDWSDGDPRLGIDTPFARQITKLPISLSLTRYIALYAVAYDYLSEVTDLKVYKVWLE